MPRIRSFSYVVPTKDGTREGKSVTINYDPKSEVFYINLPEHLDLSAHMGKGSSYNGATAESEYHRDGRIESDLASGVEDAFKHLCRRYCESVKKARKVIAYTLRWCKRGEWGEREQNGMAFDDGTGLVVQWEKGWEVRLGKEQSLFFDHDPTDPENEGLCTGQSMKMVGHRGVDDNGALLDWTQEREDFFVALSDKLEAMIGRARKFLDDPKTLQLAIDAGHGLKMIGMEKKR